jgi:hypothetical protein
MATKRPEAEQPRPGEVQIGEMTMTEFLQLKGWKSKRMGKPIFNPTAAVAVRPIFVSQAEFDDG